ncbi:MAG TPA: pitrilysin family protein [Candidatus Doudnabacteria bacterium]|nr:pitrilysin family protein [Candidatus Doudnabacteria bacterium]
MKYYKRVLKNKLTIIEVPSTDAESVVVDFFVKTGSRSETPKENGISHFLEHFLFKGTKKYPSAMSITELVDGIGGEMNANTGKEHTQYFIKAHHSRLEMIFEILTDMIQNPLLDKPELEREKGVIVEEINMYQDSPRAVVGNLLEEIMWPRQALGRDIAGRPETVTKFTQGMFRSYLERHYQTGNIILGISGKYDRKKLNQLIKKYWDKIPAKKHNGWDKSKNGQSAPRVAVKYKDTQQAHFDLGFKSFGYDDRRGKIATVLSSLLGGGMSSRLFTEIREKRGLAYYVRAGQSAYIDTGVFDISAGVRVSKLEEAIEVTLSELSKIAAGDIEAKELSKAKEFIKGKTTLYLEDNQARLDWYLEQTAFKKSVKSPAEAFREIDSVTVAQVSKVARELFDKKKLSLAVVGPYKKTMEKKLEKIISKWQQ